MRSPGLVRLRYQGYHTPAIRVGTAHRFDATSSSANAADQLVDLFRERSVRYLFPDISTQTHLEHTVRLAASGRVRLKETITHVLSGIDSVPNAFEITANKGKYRAINPAQVMMRASPGSRG